MREIVLDTETTGLDPFTGDRLVELGCVELENFVPTGNNFHAYINPERDMPDEAYRIHGLSADFLSDKPLFSQVAADFLSFIGDASLIIHNAEFDMKFINFELRNVGFPDLPMSRVVDTLAIARRKHPGSPNSLDALCSRYRIDNSRRTKHGALLDSEILAEVYVELMGGRQTALTLQQRERETAPETLQPLLSRRDAALIRELDADEQAAHRQMVNQIGEKAFWLKYN